MCLCVCVCVCVCLCVHVCVCVCVCVFVCFCVCVYVCVCDLYIGLLQCPVCKTHTQGMWCTQLNTLFVGAFEELFRVSELGDIMAFDSRVPHELQRDCWLPMVIQEFENFYRDICCVVDRLIEDKLIKKTPRQESGHSRSRARTFREPNTRITLKTNGHMSELLNGEFQSLVWEDDFIQAVTNRLQEGATWKV